MAATTSASVSLLAQPPPAATTTSSSSLWRGVAAAARAPARFAPTPCTCTCTCRVVVALAQSHSHAARAASAKRRRMRSTMTPRSFAVTVRCGGAEALRSDVDVDVDAQPAVSPSVVPRSVPVRVAYELQQAGHRYLDVRTEGEFSAGHPEGAVNIPYMHKTGSGMTKNTHFLEQVSRIFGKDDEIIVGCQSGKRSLMAATELCSAGFTAVTDIAGGFSAWSQNELPTIQ